ncbi:MAG: hypothetical protein CMQ14_07835 [Gammaproteobacteria bacterium]|nr:hypothetical protein [Gammaproteobacteria bacterium]
MLRWISIAFTDRWTLFIKLSEVIETGKLEFAGSNKLPCRAIVDRLIVTRMLFGVIATPPFWMLSGRYQLLQCSQQSWRVIMG